MFRAVEGASILMFLRNWDLCFNLPNQRILNVAKVVDGQHLSVIFVTFRSFVSNFAILVMSSLLNFDRRNLFVEDSQFNFCVLHGLGKFVFV